MTPPCFVLPCKSWENDLRLSYHPRTRFDTLRENSLAWTVYKGVDRFMLENLSSRLQKVLRDLRGQGKVSEKHLEESIRQIRLALLEADVDFRVVKSFVTRVKEKAVGREVLRSLTPVQQIVAIVRDELIDLLGGNGQPLTFAKAPPTVILMVGLQGSGKTTTTGKLARWLQQQGRSPLMVSTDVYRPAAIDQLRVIGQDLKIPVFEISGCREALELALNALRQASDSGHDVLLVDTAGRLHIDRELMRELQRIEHELKPQETLLIADAMTGQDAVKSAGRFDQSLQLSGVVLTKMDGDARGGAALSICWVTGQPIKFIGVGEHYQALEVFHPDRMAGRILGMGDVLTLVEKAEAVVDQQRAEEMVQRIRQKEFTLQDFLDQLRQLRKLGPLEKVMEMLPRVGPMKTLNHLNVDEKALTHLEAIMSSMTPGERLNYKLIKASRRKRIARGSGRPVAQVNRLLKQYVQTRKMMKRLGKGFLGAKLTKVNFPV